MPSISDASGMIFDIQKFSIHDGPGIRTTVFMKGCPLRCVWCHNPESQSDRPEMSFIPSKCIGCGWCAKACPESCHSLQDGVRLFKREACVRCGKCAERCYARALELVGRRADVPEVMAEVLKDKAFYESSGGGMTLSGGEPFFQPKFASALLAAAKGHGLHTCVETCGFASWSVIGPALKDVDILLYDVKESDPARHEECTGAPLAPIIENLERADASGAKTILRCPIVPGLNDRPEHFRSIGLLAERLKNATGINVIPYHPLGMSKSERFGTDARLKDNAFPSEDAVKGWIAEISRHTSKPCS